MLTSSEILKEYTKCLIDPIYAIETYLETFDKTQEGFVPFKLFYKQKEIIKAYESHRFNIITKPRQAGVSTTTAAYLSIKVAFADKDNPEAILILANKQDMAQEFLAKVKDFLLQLPRWVWGSEYYGSPQNEAKSIFLTESKKELMLPNKSRVKAVATSKDALRGYTPTHLVMDEAAFIDNGVIVFGAALTALGTGGHATLISTPNGQDPLYYETYEQAKQGKNNFNVIEMKWYEDPRYNKDLRWYKEVSVEGEDEKKEIMEWEVEFTKESYERRIKDGWKPRSHWYDEMCKGMNNNARMIAQELDVSFLGSGGNVISDEYIEYQEKFNVIEPKWVHGEEDEFWIWEKPVEGHRYIMGCLPPNEKVMTNNGLKNIEDVSLYDKLINENGDYVNIINKQIYPVVNEDIFEIKVSNTYRTTTFTKEHPILVSKNPSKYSFNYIRVEEVEVGDWIKVPNIYKKNIIKDIDSKWSLNIKINENCDINSPLKKIDFWWLIGVWLTNGWLENKDGVYTISFSFKNDDLNTSNKIFNIIGELFNITPFITNNDDLVEIKFESKFIHHFILENFGHQFSRKKISEWVKYIDINYKKSLISGFLNNNFNSNLLLTNNNLELLESIQDILFSFGFVSSLDKLNYSKIIDNYNMCLQDDIYELILDEKNKLELIEFLKTNNNSYRNSLVNDEFCFFDENNDYIFFKIEDIQKYKFTGNVYNFECETHTFMCHHITTHNCDVARGDGADASTIVIIDMDTMEEVMEYQGKIQPDLFADIIEEYGNLYNAYAVVDITGGMGVTTILKLIEKNYKNLHYDDRKKVIGKVKDLEGYSKSSDLIPGFNANGVRLPMVAHLEYMIRTNQIKIRSRRLTSELRTFIYKNGRPDHAEGKHDDLLMALAMALFTLEHSFKKLEKLEKKTKAMLDAWIMTTPSDDVDKRLNNNNGFVSKENRKKEATPKPKFPRKISRNMQDPNGDYMWLFSGFK